MRTLMPRTLLGRPRGASSASPPGAAAQSSRPMVRNRLAASCTAGTLRSARARRCRICEAARELPDPALVGRRRGGPRAGPVTPGTAVTVLDPACGDGRFLLAAAGRLRAAGAGPSLVGVDVDDAAIAAAGALGDRARRRPPSTATPSRADLDAGAGSTSCVTNPPFLSQLPPTTTSSGTSRHGGGPYADAAAEFLALAVRAARPGRRAGRARPAPVAARARVTRRRCGPRSTASPPGCGRGGRPGRSSTTPRSWRARWSSSGGPVPVPPRRGAVDRRGHRCPRRAGVPPLLTRWSAGRPGPPDGQLPRPVLRAGPGRRDGGTGPP